jgi:acetate CoA/acetoacetate CoA-transferase beta subunit
MLPKGSVMDARELIAKRVAREFRNGDYVNLGIGLPTLVAEYLPADVNVILHSENGFLGLGPAPEKADPDLTNAGGRPAGILPGGASFDSAVSFAIIRGGHLTAAVLGALEADEEGNLANWIVPGVMAPGMGGAMDLVVGARRVILAMQHTSKGRPKILRRCTLPLTAVKAAHMIVTELAVFQYLPKLTLTELAPGVSMEQVREATQADYEISPDLKSMPVC